MRRRVFCIFFMLITITFSAYSAKKVQSPNFIFIYSDDQRFDALGSNENEIIHTPSLDKLAEKAIRFTNANVVFSLCSPSRAALLTGRYGSANGVLELGSDLNKNEKTVAQYLQEKGYKTGISGKWHIGRKPQDAGFDFSVHFLGNGKYYKRAIFDQGKEINPDKHCDIYCAERSVDFLKEAVESGKPFFLYHNTQLPHMNHRHAWNAKDETKAMYKLEDMPVAENKDDDLSDKPEYLKSVRNLTQAKKYAYPNAEAIQKHTRDYYSVITEMDDALSQLFKTIDELNLWDNSYIFFMSDNGWMLGDHGFTSKVLPYRPSTHVPLLIAGPDIQKSINNKLVLNIDMAPTILELAGIKPAKNIHGESIVPILEGKNKIWRDAFVYEGLGTYGGAKPNLTVISEQYRYIVTYTDEYLTDINYRELYDQNDDPQEMNNLLANSSLDDRTGQFDKRIKKHLQIIKH